MGLRLKFHLILLPTVLVALAVMIAADYYYQLDALMDAHAVHASAIPAQSVRIGAVESPDSVARRNLVSHGLHGAALIVLVALAADAALTILVLRPAALLREQLSRIERGQWHSTCAEQSRDELGALCAAFQRLGPELGALVHQTVQAERLATTALVTKRLTSRIEREVQEITRTVAAMLERRIDAEDAARVIAPAAGRIVQALREFDPLFVPLAVAAGAVRRATLDLTTGRPHSKSH
jgi:methyl-accepting chemotaxis protein